MPYITFTEYPDAPGRQYRDACTDPATGAIACEVDEVLDGETEIAAEEHAKVRAAAEVYHEANPPVAPDPPAPQPTIEDIIAVLSPETRAALDAHLKRK